MSFSSKTLISLCLGRRALCRWHDLSFGEIKDLALVGVAMSPKSDPGVSLLPANGPHLTRAIDIALTGLRKWSEAEGQNWDKLGERDARLWRELLEQTRAKAMGGCAPNLSKSELAVPAVYELTGRGWSSFMVWFRREIRGALVKACAAERVPVLVPVRRSNRSGGWPETSEAIYYLAFDQETVPASGTKADKQIKSRGAVGIDARKSTVNLRVDSSGAPKDRRDVGGSPQPQVEEVTCTQKPQESFNYRAVKTLAANSLAPVIVSLVMCIAILVVLVSSPQRMKFVVTEAGTSDVLDHLPIQRLDVTLNCMQGVGGNTNQVATQSDWEVWQRAIEMRERESQRYAATLSGEELRRYLEEESRRRVCTPGNNGL